MPSSIGAPCAHVCTLCSVCVHVHARSCMRAHACVLMPAHIRAAQATTYLRLRQVPPIRACWRLARTAGGWRRWSRCGHQRPLVQYAAVSAASRKACNAQSPLLSIIGSSPMHQRRPTPTAARTPTLSAGRAGEAGGVRQQGGATGACGVGWLRQRGGGGGGVGGAGGGGAQGFGMPRVLQALGKHGNGCCTSALHLR